MICLDTSYLLSALYTTYFVRYSCSSRIVNSKEYRSAKILHQMPILIIRMQKDSRWNNKEKNLRINNSKIIIMWTMVILDMKKKRKINKKDNFRYFKERELEQVEFVCIIFSH